MSTSLRIYNLFLKAYFLAIKLFAAKNTKAEKWISGRQNPLPFPIKNNFRIWFHCASVGEFEQGRPLIEALKKQHADYEIILTFFSPSGFEAFKKYALACWVGYLPLDHAVKSPQFIKQMQPDLAVFVKYDHWFYYLNYLKTNAIPTFLISAHFRKKQLFFKRYGAFYKKMLHAYTHIFVQDFTSLQLLNESGIKPVSVAGDTRYDRVLEIAHSPVQLPLIADFLNGSKALIAGSTWPQDEEILMQLYQMLPPDWKLIIAPHEINPAQMQKLLHRTNGEAVLYSQLGSQNFFKRMLLIDNVGMLSRLYNYGDIAWVGGGFKSGIHNILEPAAFGLPIIFGPENQKFLEAQEMKKAGSAFEVKNAAQAKQLILPLLSDAPRRNLIAQNTRVWMHEKKGATRVILSFLNNYLPRQ